MHSSGRPLFSGGSETRPRCPSSGRTSPVVHAACALSIIGPRSPMLQKKLKMTGILRRPVACAIGRIRTKTKMSRFMTRPHGSEWTSHVFPWRIEPSP